MSAVCVEGVVRVYDSGERAVAALRGVTFALSAGEFVALMGPSGCGKSTLLHLIGGMDRPSRGHVTLGGIRLDSLRDDELARVRRERVGFVFQFFNLLPTLTVAENVALPLMLDGASEKQSRVRVMSLIERVGLLARAAHYPAELSGGEMQRAAVARAVIAQPDVVLADEPTGNLDSANGAEVMELFRELNRELGITILLATHSEEAAARARRVIRLRDGVIESDQAVQA